MMSKLYFFCLAALGLPLSAAASFAQESVPLPVRKVELYKNGMGFFEHVGTVKGSQTVEISLPSSQLNDVLKSLTVLDLGHGQISGVNYDSTAPLDRRLSETPINFGFEHGIVDFLNQIRGAGIEVRAPGGVISGKLMGAEVRTRSTGPGASFEAVQVSIYTGGEVRLVELESAGALKITEPALAGDLGRYLDLLDTSHRRDIRRLKIQTSGTGERQLYVSYTAESPIWKTTYRIVLDPKQKALLQGWAIVDNTTPMDWINVSLSLVAGAPISFIQNLSQPIYGKRPVIPLPEGVQANPQVYEAAMEPQAAPSVGPGSGGGVGSGVGGVRREMMMAAAAPAAPAPLDRLGGLSDAIRQQVTETAQAQAIGEQFEYKLRQPITIRRDESALLPILQSDIDGEKVSIYSVNSGDRHPRLAFWLKNTSGLTLDAGAVTVIDTDTFAGEGLVGTIQPGENRLLSYAVDLGTEISATSGSERQRIERVQINRGILRMFSQLVEKKTYKIRNNSDKARTVILEHPVRSGWNLVQTTPPAETSANYYRFKVEVKPKTTTEFSVREESPQEYTYSISSVTPEQIAVWVRERSIDPEIEKPLGSIAAKKNEISDLNQKLSALDKEQSDIFKDQERVRGNLQRLGQTPEEASLRQRYIRQLEGQENRLGAIRVEHDKLEAARNSAQKQLDDLIQTISFDKKL